MKSSRKGRSVRRGTVTFEGELTWDRADSIREKLIREIIDADSVEIRLGRVTAVDLSFLQLLCAAHRSAVRLNKKISLTGRSPLPFKEAVKDAGYARTIGCSPEREESCLWSEHEKTGKNRRTSCLSPGKSR